VLENSQYIAWHIIFLLYRNENLCWTVIKIKIKPIILASIEEDTIISSIQISKLLNPVVAHMQIRIRILRFSSVTFKTPTKTNLEIKCFSTYYFLMVPTLTSFFKDKKVKKKSQNSRNEGFFYYFCLLIEGSGSRTGSIR
jgi:hypothetical protein